MVDTDTPILSVRDLTVQFTTSNGVVRAVDGVSFDVGEGEIVGIVGESGAGKSVATTSILRLLDDAGEITAGEITFDGETIAGFEEPGLDPVPRDDMLSEEEMRREIRGSRIAKIFQDPSESLNPVYTVGDQLREFIELNRDLDSTTAKEEAIEMLRRVGIPEPEARYSNYPHEFSGGMQQRVLIAMALGCRPDVIIADEPTTALDVTVEAQILELVREVRDEYGTSFVWVTHDMGVIAEICDRVNVMYLGEIVEQGSVRDIFHETSHPYTRGLLDSIPRPDRTIDEIDPIDGIMPSAIDPPRGCRFHTRCPDARTACRETDPNLLEHGEADGHRTACLKYDDASYDESRPLAPADETVTATEQGAEPAEEPAPDQLEQVNPEETDD